MSNILFWIDTYFILITFLYRYKFPSNNYFKQCLKFSSVTPSWLLSLFHSLWWLRTSSVEASDSFYKHNSNNKGSFWNGTSSATFLIRYLWLTYSLSWRLCLRIVNFKWYNGICNLRFASFVYNLIYLDVYSNGWKNWIFTTRK